MQRAADFVGSFKNGGLLAAGYFLLNALTDSIPALSEIRYKLNSGSSAFFESLTAQMTGQSSETKGQATAGTVDVVSGAAPGAPSPDPDNGKNKDLKRLGKKEIEDRTGTSVHDVKDVIRDQFGKEFKENGFGTNFDLMENEDGNLILEANKKMKDNTKPTINTGTTLESFGVN